MIATIMYSLNNIVCKVKSAFYTNVKLLKFLSYCRVSPITRYRSMPKRKTTAFSNLKYNHCSATSVSSIRMNHDSPLIFVFSLFHLLDHTIEILILLNLWVSTKYVHSIFNYQALEHCLHEIYF